MTLPFRRRHHDAEAGHDRARVLMSEALLATLRPDDAAWLGRHLDSCTECGRDWKAFRADHRLLRSLREQPLEPPRDLWARTSAALDREARRRGSPVPRAARPQPAGGFGLRALPLGAIAGAVVVAVIIGSGLIDLQPQAAASAAPGTAFANGPTAGPTGLTLPDADPVSIFRRTASGSWELVSMDVTEVCPPSDRGCVPQQGGKGQSIDLGGPPSEVTLGDRQLVISSPPENGGGGDVLVVPVRRPGESPAPSRRPTDGPTSAPSTSEEPSPTPAATPEGAVAIATGVRVIGDVAYSEDGRWLAFSAAPADDSTGPDLYVWSVGAETATPVTSDHQTYFASWHRGRILASRVEVAGVPAQPAASTDPGTSVAPGATDKPGRGNDGGNQGGGNGAEKTRATPAPTSSAEATPATSASPAPASVEGHPVSFLLDPESLERTDLTQPDVWLPVLDPSGRYVTYWFGTVRSDDGGRRWALGTGELVLDAWSSGDAAPTETSRATSSSAGATSAPSPGASPIGPSGQPTTLVPGAKATFEASFDPDGVHLAVWIGEGLDESVGRLHLVVIDPSTGAVDTASPLRGEAALRRFTIDKGRVAWVTPSGQDGQESSVQVLGWKGDDFGEIETEPASDLYLP